MAAVLEVGVVVAVACRATRGINRAPEAVIARRAVIRTEVESVEAVAGGKAVAGKAVTAAVVAIVAVVIEVVVMVAVA